MGKMHLERRSNLTLIHFSELRDIIVANTLRINLPRNSKIDRTGERTLDEFYSC